MIQMVFLFKFLINMKKKLKFLQKIVFFDNFSFFFLEIFGKWKVNNGNFNKIQYNIKIFAI